MPGPPGVVLGGGAGAVGGAVLVTGRRQLGQDPGGQPVAGAGRGEQPAAGQLAEGGVGVGVPDERGQMGLVRHLTAEGHREPQRVAGGVAQPGGEQGRGRRGLAEAGQRHLGFPGRLGRGRRVGGPVLQVAVLVVRGGVGAQLVAPAQQRTGLDEAQGQALGLEPEVSGPVGLLLGELPFDHPAQQVERGGAVEAGEEDLFERGVGAGRGGLGRGGEQEGALGGRVEEFAQGGAAELQVVQHDDGAGGAQRLQQEHPVRPVPGASWTASKSAYIRSVAVRLWPLRRTTPSGAKSAQSAATAASRAVRPEPAGPVSRTERPRARRRVSRSRSSSRRSSGSWGTGGPGGTGGVAARARSARSSGVRRTGAAGRSPGGHGSTSLPSTGLTVSVRSPATRVTMRTCCGVC